MTGWRFEERLGDLEHCKQAFFAVRGIDVQASSGVLRSWQQPIIDQSEIGVLGFLLHRGAEGARLLVQAKMEPGNINGAQIGPTVQATRSNYSRAHGGARTRYLEYFLDASGGDVTFDALQSEQGSRFLAKRNRNMIVDVPAEIAPEPGHEWMPLTGLLQLLRFPHLLNMDTRSVLSCLPLRELARAAAANGDATRGGRTSDLHAAIDRSCQNASPARFEKLRAWLHAVRRSRFVTSRLLGLRQVGGWHYDGRELFHEARRHFSVIGVSVETSAREVVTWDQPMIRSVGQGLVALGVRRQGGQLNVLVQAMSEAGSPAAELGPTVQCITGNYRDLPASQQPPLLTHVLSGRDQRVWFDNVLSEEGGRFYRKENRYLIVEFLSVDEPPSPWHRWISIGDLAAALRMPGYVNVELRSLFLCLFAV